MITYVNWSSRFQNILLLIVSVLVALSLIFMPISVQAATFSNTQIERLAGIAVGESSSDPYSVACVMYNRLQGGWAPQYVQNAFYAKWKPPTNEQFSKIKNILLTGEGCNHDAWYQFATGSYTATHTKPGTFLFESGGNSFYSKEALK